MRIRSGSDIRYTSWERRAYQRNVSFGVANGALMMLADTLLHPSIVLALFVSQISDSNLLVGLVPAMATGIWFLPQLLAAALVQGRLRQVPYVVWSTVIRALSIGALGVMGFVVSEDSPSTLLVTFFIAYTIYNLAAGFANVPMIEVAARTIPGNRRGFYFGQRSFWGGVLGFMSGFLIQRILSQSNDFPMNFGLLFMAAFAALALGTYAAAMLQEPRPANPGSRGSLLNQLGDVPRFLGNDDFRRFLTYRSFLSLSAIADPFYVIYAQQQLDAPAPVIGLYISAMTVARFGSNLFWSPMADRRGNRLVLQLSALLRMTIPLWALGMPQLLRWAPVADRMPGGDSTIYYLFGLVFVLYGFALSGQNLANMTYVLDIAPEEDRAAYVGLINTILGVVSFVPVVGGTVVDRFGFETLFLITFLIGLGGIMASGLLHEPRVLGSVNLFSASVFSRERLWSRSRRFR